ncbi:MAG: A/G-specific adenine glycosylase [Proteobacteria bacterium]|nr:A/G-specific adenine glycosylase [Pseudomonadota bacterium]
MPSFSSALIVWQRDHGRHGLPWQSAGPYPVWLSEIMLQQTQVATVIPYYQRFIASFPTIAALASASEEQVLAHWSGLGYYARGRNLHRAAQIVVDRHGGEFPCQYEQLLALPGIGRSTAAAICAQAYHQPYAILDGNVKRVLARYCGINGSPAIKSVEDLLWRQAEALLPQHDIAVYTQALMDMGATLCTRSKPLCGSCPVQGDCAAFQTGRVAELPSPRQRRAVPERQATLLLVMHGRDILLEKRGPAGIWGGLWCLPQFDDEAAALVWCAQQGMATDKVIRHPRAGGDPAISIKPCEAPIPFTHTFTHFKLHIAPMLLNLADKPLQVQQTGHAWMDVSDALSAAIPTPVRKLLAGILPGGQ